ncbi:MAG: competence/damage-inducible protein A [Chloroflexi bacterium]|nr:competence/damage-inducible protein A [Chloroflexota bacterium]
MNADIISIGTELLMGELVDTNAPYLAARLPSMGIRLQGVAQAGDDIEMLVQVLRHASQRSDLVLTTGGLGPTEDDLTREAIARLLEEVSYVHPRLLQDLKETFRQRGSAMPETNIKQATLIPSATSVTNSMGTAPGWWVENRGKIIVAMPGPPAEMHRMWEMEVEPKLYSYPRGEVTVTRSLKTFGLGEGALNEKVAHLFHLSTVRMGMYAQAQGVQLRIRASASTTDEAQRLISPVEQEIRDLVGDYIWGVDEETLEEQVGQSLRDLRLTLAAMESCTGGLLAHTITQVPGSSDYFKGGVVSYTNETKIALGVDPTLLGEHGAVSPEVAQDMARAIRRRLNADLGVGITGVAGPAEIEGKPAGTVHIGLAHRDGTLSFSRRYPAQRPLVKQRATTQALLELWNLLNRIRSSRDEATRA